MRSMITAVIVFILVIAIVITGNIVAKQCFIKLDSYIEEMIKYAKNDNYKDAIYSLNDADLTFNNMKNTLGIIFNHNELEKIETSFARARQYLKYEDKSNSMAEIAELKWLIWHLPESEKCNLENLF